MLKNFTKILTTFLLLLIVNVSQAQDNMQISINAPSSLATNWLHGVEFASANSTSIAVANRWSKPLQVGDRITGDIVIVRDSVAGDSITANGCNTVFNAAALKGKIALISRGTCGFSIKAFNAWKAGAIAVIGFNNTGPNAIVFPNATRPQADSVSGSNGLPFVFTTQENGLKIRNALLNGQTVNATFYIPNAYDISAAYAYNTPQKEAIPLTNLSVIFNNSLNGDSVTRRNITFTATVKSPTGATQTLTTKVDTVKGKAIIRVTFPPYNLNKTSPLGNYQVVAKNSFSSDSLKTDFNLVSRTFALDDGKLGTFRLGINSAAYNAAANGKIFDAGTFFLTGGDTTKATHISFALNNPDSFPVGDQFAVQVYKVSNANYTKFDNDAAQYTDLESDIVSELTYNWKKTEKADSSILIELPKPVDLTDSSIYLVSIRYDGSIKKTNNPPLFSMTTGRIYPQFGYYCYYYEPFFGRSGLYADVFGSNYNLAIRMYTRQITSDTKDLPALAENQVKVFPNPISDSKLNIEFDLKNVADVVNLQITDLQGNIVRTDKLYNVQKGVHQTDISNLANGTYFITSVTKEGWRTKSFQVIK